MNRLPLIIALAAALALPAAATAASIDDLRALGYTVSTQFESPTCKALTVSGYGVSTSLGCEGTPDFQAAVDSLASPAGHCNRKWQFEHPDQLAALGQLGSLGYAVTGDQCADSYTVSNSFTGAAVYTGAGGGLPGLAASLPQATAPAPTTGDATSATTQTAPATTCLPLCATPTPPTATVTPTATTTSTVPATTSAPTVTSTPTLTATTAPLAQVTIADTAPKSTSPWKYKPLP